VQEFTLGYITAVATIVLIKAYHSYKEVKDLREKSEIMADILQKRAAEDEEK